jgi:hypothetical protein
MYIIRLPFLILEDEDSPHIFINMYTQLTSFEVICLTTTLDFWQMYLTMAIALGVTTLV